MKWACWAFLLFFSFYLMFHTFSYDGKNHAMQISTKAWSDFGQHIPMIRSFSLGNNWPPEFPLYPGEPMRYHFLFYAFVGFLEKLGLRIDWALNIPSALGFFLLIMMIYRISSELFKNRFISALSIIFFLLNGSLSFVPFFQNHSFADIFTNSQFPSFAPWGPGDISAFWNLNIYTNQRHLGLAFGIALSIIYLFLKLENQPLKKQFPWVIPTSLILGIFPYFHQPTLLILAIFMLIYWVNYPKLRTFLTLVGLLAFVFILPQIFHLGSSAFSWYPGYLIHDSLSLPRFLSYWWQNLGLHAIFIPIGFFLIPAYARKALLPIFFIFLIPNLFKFSVEVAASHKFFNFVLLLGSMISAFVVVKLRNYVLIFVLVVFLTLSGIIDFFAVYNDPKGSIKDIPADETATWILNNTPRDAVFLNSSYFYHPASIAGRKIFLGWPYFPWSVGYTGDRTHIMKTVYESQNPSVFCPLLTKENISFLTVEDTDDDPNLPKIPVNYFVKTFQPVFELNNKYFIFSTQELCQ